MIDASPRQTVVIKRHQRINTIRGQQKMPSR